MSKMTLKFGDEVLSKCYPKEMNQHSFSLDSTSIVSYAGSPPSRAFKVVRAKFVLFTPLSCGLIVQFREGGYSGTSAQLSASTKQLIAATGLDLQTQLFYWLSISDVFVQKQQSTAVAKKRGDDPFPHSCPQCKSKAYVGFSTVECCGVGCKHYATFGGVK